jgi:hypothetical protein
MKIIRVVFVIVILGLWFLVISSLDNYVLTPYPPLTPEEISIAENLWNHPQPKTNVFTGIGLITYADPKTLADTGSAAEICAKLSQFYIWEPDDYGDDIYFSVQRTSEYKVNYVMLRPPDREFSALAVGITRFENGLSGKVLGSHGGTIYACFKTENIPEGLNLAGLNFKSTSGKLYSYNWAFKLTKENQIIHVELPDAIKE